MNEAWRTRFYDALGPLGWGFREGDDGDAITLTLDELDSLLRELPALQESDAKSLGDLVLECGKDGDVVDRLYEIGAQHSYGEGLSAARAREVSSLAEDVARIIEECVDEQQGKQRKSPSKRRRRAKK